MTTIRQQAGVAISAMLVLGFAPFLALLKAQPAYDIAALAFRSIG